MSTDAPAIAPLVSDFRAAGRFVMGNPPDIWWVSYNYTSNSTATNITGPTIRNHLDACQPCDDVDGCSNYVSVPQSYIDSLTIGSNFTCAMLPIANGTNYTIFDLGRNMAGFCSMNSLPPAPQGTTM